MRVFLAVLLLAAGLGGAGLGSDAALAQQLGPRLQDATIIGRGNVITIRRMLVRTPDGVVYRDITISLQVDASGALHVDAAGVAPKPGSAARATVVARQSEPVVTHDVTVGSITETATAPEVAAPFTPGTYRSASGGLVTVVKQGDKLFEGFPTWTLSAMGGDNVISDAEWYAGPLRTNPRHRWIAGLGISSDDYSYGTIDGSGSGHFDSGMLIGAVQKGNELLIVSFHRHGCCTYATEPTGQVTFTRIGG